MLLRRLKYSMTSYGFSLTFGITLLFGLHSVLSSLRNLPFFYPDTPFGISELPPAFSIFLISFDSKNYMLYKLIFPVLALLPAAFTYTQEAHAGSDLYFILRKNRAAYYWSSLGLAFISTFVAIALPLIITTGIAHLILPEFSVFEGGAPWMVFEQYLAEGRLRVLFPGVLINSPFASTILVSLATGGLAALYGCLMLVVSYFIPRDSVAGQIALVLPVFLFSQAMDTVGRAAGFEKYNPLDLLAIGVFGFGNKHYLRLVLLIVVSLCLIVGGTLFKSRRDVL